jgi:hypothetical protein
VSDTPLSNGSGLASLLITTHPTHGGINFSQPVTMRPGPAPDPISPPHYRAPNGLEVRQFIEAFGLNWHLGEAVAHIMRADRKGCAGEDIRKAIKHLQQELEVREQQDVIK